MKEFIRKRIMELNTEILAKKKEIEVFERLPLSERTTPNMMQKNREMKRSLNLLLDVRVKNEDILKGRH